MIKVQGFGFGGGSTFKFGLIISSSLSVKRAKGLKIKGKDGKLLLDLKSVFALY